MTVKYIRDLVGLQFRPIGCVVIDDSGHVGYSLCAPADLHKDTGMSFKARARQIAVARAELGLVRIDHEGNWYRQRNGGPKTRVPVLAEWGLDLVVFMERERKENPGREPA